MDTLNAALTEVFKFLQSWRSLSVVQWFTRILALTGNFLSSDWPENYPLKDGERFDYIVVGSGSGGAVVAARLSEIQDFKVLLIEAGGDPPPNSVIPGLLTTLQGSDYDWKYKIKLPEGIGQAHPDRVMAYPRGKVLGGSSSINYFIYARGKPEDYNEWNETAPGWDWNTVLYYFKKLEGMKDPSIFESPQNAILHNTDGPVKVSRPVTLPSTKIIDGIRLESFAEMGIKTVLENNGPEDCGAARPHFTLYDGRRSSTAEAYLKPNKDRPNLKVAKYSTVIKVLIEPQTLRAYGVEVLTSNNTIIKVYCNEEVILSAGSFNTPKILWLSGVGPKEELTKLGIQPIVDLPVGENLHDHKTIQLLYKGKFGLESSVQNILETPQIDTLPVPVQCGFFSVNSTLTANSSKFQPQFQFFNPYVGAGASPIVFWACKFITSFDNALCASQAKANALNEIDNVLLVPLHPLSRGHVRLKSNDPKDDPIIEFEFYKNPYDLQLAVEGVKFMNTLINTTYYRKVGGSIPRLAVAGCENILWGTDEYWTCYVKNIVGSLFHASGTCRMGKDDGVVDERLRVHYMDGLRVVDASIIPKIPSGNTNVPVMMIGEKAADMIKEDFYRYKSVKNDLT